MKTYKLPKGFTANGIHCGAKKKRKDLTLFFSESSCKVAAVFTQNQVKAAPVVLAEKQLAKESAVRAVVVNSGNANCMTGRRGMNDAKKMAQHAAKLLGVAEREVLVSSTGIIGEFMDMKPILGGMPKLVEGLSPKGVVDAADGIMTTDSFRKVISRTFTVGRQKINMIGIAKGAGMIDPSMATMLCYIMTDANISKKALAKALAESNEISFNAMTVDGDMSTNDTVMLLANGKAGNKLIAGGTKAYKSFKENLDAITVGLTKMVVRDGEGASKFIEVKVKGAKTAADAKKVADSIGSSLLVKCAVLGGDPNWGRIASSAGASGVKINTDKMKITLDGVVYFRNGKALAHDDRKKSSVFKKKDVRIEVDLVSGKKDATVYTCDISKKYITLNSYYTT